MEVGVIRVLLVLLVFVCVAFPISQIAQYVLRERARRKAIAEHSRLSGELAEFEHELGNLPDIGGHLAKAKQYSNGLIDALGGRNWQAALVNLDQSKIHFGLAMVQIGVTRAAKKQLDDLLAQINRFKTQVVTPPASATEYFVKAQRFYFEANFEFVTGNIECVTGKASEGLNVMHLVWRELYVAGSLDGKIIQLRAADSAA